MKFPITLVALALLSASAQADSHPHWDYSGEGAPNNWGKLSQEFANCEKGVNQAPVDISDVIKGELPPLSLTFHVKDKSIINNGHTIQLNVNDGDTLMLDKTEFRLQQFHFHAPSENHINGKAYPLEIHFVHSNAKGELAVVAVMVDRGAENPAIAEILKNIPAKRNDSKALVKPLPLADLMPGDKNYYRFNGSLTTPPCTEGVRWLVMKETVTASSQQIKAIKAALGHANNRPLQPLNARVIID